MQYKNDQRNSGVTLRQEKTDRLIDIVDLINIMDLKERENREKERKR